MALPYRHSRLERPACRLGPFALILMIAAMSGCASSRAPIHTESAAETDEPFVVEARLRSEYSRWKGTPHVIGGQSARGMDCSAYVQRVFGDAFNLDLPRTTEAQVKEGRRVARGDLQPGDLVFFLPPKTRHVGIYLGNGEFTHASSSEGVTVSDLDQPYWRESYWTSRRILTDDLSPSSRTAVTVSDAPAEKNGTAAGGGRVGW